MRLVTALVSLGALLTVVACGDASVEGFSAGQSAVVRVLPEITWMTPGDKTTFTALVTGTLSTAVTWSVQEGAPGGFVEGDGLYTAPATMGTYHVVATATGTGVSGAATIRVDSRPGPCANEPMRQTGTTYYVCDCQAGADANCVAGNDSASGTSPSTPWRSWSKAYGTFNTMAAGNTVALCKGGRWNNLPTSSAFRNKNCQVGATGTCDLRDFTPPWASGDEGRPILNVAAGAWLFPMGWGNNWVDVARGIRVLNLDIVGPGSGTANTAAFHVYGGIEDLEICGNTIRDQMMGALSGDTSSTIKRVSFHHNALTNNRLGIGPINILCTDCTIDSNYMDLNGGGSDRDHSMYIGAGRVCGPNDTCLGGYPLITNMRVTNNEIRRSSRGGGSTCGGVVMIFKNAIDGILIENNLFVEEPGATSGACYGIGAGGDGSETEWLKNVIIRRNRFFNIGGAGIALQSCEDCTVDSNLVVTGNNSYVGIAFPAGAAVGTAYTNSTRGKIRNNVVYVPTGTNIEYGIRSGWSAIEGDGWIVTNNVVQTAFPSLSCFRLLGASGQYAAVANNNCHGTANWGTDPVTPVASRLFVNPQFVAATTNPATANFSLSVGSLLIDAGNSTHYAPSAPTSSTWSASESSTSRPLGLRPDIGTFER